MTHKNKVGVTRRGLLWATGLAAVPLPPVAAFDLKGADLPWEDGRTDPQAPALSAREVTKPRVKRGD